MDAAFIWGALAMGLVGNFHCLGMCGPIALAVPLGSRKFAGRVLGALLYNGGRILIYASLGALFGIIGKGFNLFGYQQILSISLGVIIIAAVLIPRLARIGNRTTSVVGRFTGKLKSRFAKQLQNKSYGSLFVIGLLNGLLPCGLVYLAMAGAVVVGNWYSGAAYMALFGVGTLPVMLSLPIISNWIGSGIRTKIRKALPVVLVVFGLLFILRGMNLGIQYVSPKMDAETETVHKCH